ncbi:MAG: FAD-dependent oxidoreductase [Hyphomonadaceae bacterium]
MDVDTLLKIARVAPGQNRFALGTFEKGITLFRQQVRALNLIYALTEAKKVDGGSVIPQNSTLAIIGGGAFGMTAAVAAAHAGFKAVLLERQQTLMPMQRGCATRWLHPRLYDWPAFEAETRLARLPFLSWSAGMAGQVVLDIEEKFQRAKSVCGNRLKRVLGVKRTTVTPLAGTEDFEVAHWGQDSNGTEVASAVIYCVGFGAEGGNSQYWRNDCFDQYDLKYDGKTPTPYFITGMGDGGLIDAFRLTIRDFSQDTIFNDIFGSPTDPLVQALRAIRSEPLPRLPAFDRLKKLDDDELPEAMQSAIGRYRDLRRHDTRVMLNAKEDSFRLALNAASVSWGHAALAYCAYRSDAFRYVPGKLNPTRLADEKIQQHLEGWIEPKQLKGIEPLIRRGPKRREAVLGANLTPDEVTHLESQKDQDTGQPIYPTGWWGKYTHAPDSGTTRVEFVPPALMMQATTFAATVAEFLRSRLSVGASSDRFRVALHRLVRLDDQEWFQQITPYFGNVDKKGGDGRIFPVLGGIVGLACHTGSQVIVSKRSQKNFDEVWELAKFDKLDARPIEKHVGALMACPFFAPNGDGQERVCMVLFVDAGDPDFFAPDTRKDISMACSSFVQTLEQLISLGAIRALPSYYSGYEVSPRDAG